MPCLFMNSIVRIAALISKNWCVCLTRWLPAQSVVLKTYRKSFHVALSRRVTAQAVLLAQAKGRHPDAVVVPVQIAVHAEVDS